MTTLSAPADPRRIYYREGYKYQLGEDYTHTLITFKLPGTVRSTFFEGHARTLTIKTGYAWDGASGPTKDSKNSMRGSLVHDALYQAMREGTLPPAFRAKVDAEFWAVLEEDKMRWWRSWSWWRAVRRFGKESATQPRPVLTAP
jgi:hypothetical protein